MVKDIVKMVVALLIVCAILAGVLYFFFGDTFMQLKNSMSDMLGIKTMVGTVTNGVTGAVGGVTEGVTGIFKH
jgi:hypothetical protein